MGEELLLLLLNFIGISNGYNAGSFSFPCQVASCKEEGRKSNRSELNNAYLCIPVRVLYTRTLYMIFETLRFWLIEHVLAKLGTQLNVELPHPGGSM